MPANDLLARRPRPIWVWSAGFFCPVPPARTGAASVSTVPRSLDVRKRLAGTEPSNRPGCVGTRDVEAAKATYAAVLGGRYEDLPAPDGRSYAQAFLPGDLVTVIAPQDDGGTCTTLVEPDEAELNDGEEIGAIATLRDPQGGVFSVLEV